MCSGQRGGGQRQGTGSHGGDDLGGNRHQGWRGRLGRGHRRSDLVVGRVETLMDQVVRGFWWLRCERLCRVSQRASGRCVRLRGETEGGDGGSGHVGTQAWIGRSQTRQAARGLRVRGRGAGRWTGSSQAGVKAVRRLQGGADGQILLVGHDGQSVTHQAVGHSPISIFSDPTVEKQSKLDSVPFRDF